MKPAVMTIAILLLAPLSLFAADDGFAPDVRINPDSETYDSHPSAAVTSDGTTWVAWHAYRGGRDRVMLRRIEADGALGRNHVISDEGSVHGPPTVVVLDDESVWVLWSAQTDSRWRVLARNLRGEVLQPAITVSENDVDAIGPTAIGLAGARLMVAWSELREGRFGIRSRQLRDGAWQASQSISSGHYDAFRPVLTADPDGTAWILWDRCDGERYNVAGRQLLPSLGPIEQVSPKDQHCLTPTALATGRGLYIAWLRKEDVIGGAGVISQWHTLHVAVRRDGGWKTITDASGDPVAAELTHGLVAKIQPRPLATGGYLGRRAAPMLMQHGSDVWLLWERKSDHAGSTPDVVGELLGRQIRQDQWREPVLLHTGLVDYHLAHAGGPRGGHLDADQQLTRGIDAERSPTDPPVLLQDGQFVMLASQLPRQTRRIYHRLVADLNNTQPFNQDRWTGWRPVDLPVQSEVPARQQIRVGEKTYQLYWADLHCHSALTCDAEGEQDELTHYARQRAMLDVVVFTNNDFLYDVPLTQHEYALGNFFADVFTRPGEFLSLPGFEWTSRIPGVATASLADPGNWTKPYRHRSYPNHRSVIFPPSGGPLVRYPEVANDISVLNEAVAKAGGITLTQHDAFQPSGHPVEVGMELTSGWRNYIARVPELFHQPLKDGTRLGFVANGDSHRRAPGLSGALTGIYSEVLTAESILEALRQRRCFATNGSRILIDARANETLMGQEVVVEDRGVDLTLHVIGTRPIESAVLIRDGEEIMTFPGEGKTDWKLRFRDNDLLPGHHWYYWRVTQQGHAPELPGNLMVAHGHLAWSTPHWVEAR